MAKESLDIPDLLEAEDMLAMAVPDKLCIVTYVSQYYNVMRNLTPGKSNHKSQGSNMTKSTSYDITYVIIAFFPLRIGYSWLSYSIRKEQDRHSSDTVYGLQTNRLY